MSRVFVARDLSLDRDVVVKVLSSESTAGVSADRFRREIQVIARLQHPHVIPILAAGSADGALYYLMPFMGGETLRARITREGPLNVADAARILREVLDALSFAHKHGVIHRDIKPENVLLEAGHAVVADFGIAKALRESGTMTSTGISLGTPAYMAPEQATADPTADHRADLYSVGVMAYEMLAGAPPFAGNAQQMITAHITMPAPALREKRSDIPATVSDLVARSLAKDPDERPQSAGEMMAALDAAVTPMATTPATLATAAARTSRTRLVTGVAAGALLAIAGTVALRSRSPRATVVDGVGSLRTTDAVTLLTRARKLTQPIPLAEAMVLGRDLGAHSVLTGTLIADGGKVRASVVLHRVGNDSTIAKATALAMPTEIASLTDSLTWQLLRQVWRRGTAPSPMLTGLTTTSFDALRAFLDGEQRWQQLDVNGALALYRRAFEADTNFAQALLRFDYVTTWHLQPPDTAIRRRLLSLTSRLPERERAWVETREIKGPLPVRYAAWKVLAGRYPDYPPALMSAADLIIHSGPLDGIPLSDVRTYIDRLVALAPENADARMHQMWVADAEGRTDDVRTAEAALRRLSGSSSGWVLSSTWKLRSPLARAAGEGPTPAQVDSGMRALLQEFATNTNKTLRGMIGFVSAERAPAERLALLAHFRSAGILQGDMDLAASAGDGLLRLARGDWLDGLRTMQRSEAADLTIAQKLSGPRMAVIGAWLGALDPAVADTTLQRGRQLPDAEKGAADRAEFRWLDGLLGVAQGDDARVRRVVHELSGDTSTYSRSAA